VDPALPRLFFELAPLGAHFVRERQPRAFGERFDVDLYSIRIVIMLGCREAEDHPPRSAQFEKYAVMHRIACRTSVDDEKMSADLWIDVGSDNAAFVACEKEAFGDLWVQPCVVDGAGRGIECMRNVQGDGIASTHQQSSVIGHGTLPEHHTRSFRPPAE